MIGEKILFYFLKFIGSLYNNFQSFRRNSAISPDQAEDKANFNNILTFMQPHIRYIKKWKKQGINKLEININGNSLVFSSKSPIKVELLPDFIDGNYRQV